MCFRFSGRYDIGWINYNEVIMESEKSMKRHFYVPQIKFYSILCYVFRSFVGWLKNLYILSYTAIYYVGSIILIGSTTCQLISIKINLFLNLTWLEDCNLIKFTHNFCGYSVTTESQIENIFGPETTRNTFWLFDWYGICTKSNLADIYEKSLINFISLVLI